MHSIQICCGVSTSLLERVRTRLVESDGEATAGRVAAALLGALVPALSASRADPARALSG